MPRDQDPTRTGASERTEDPLTLHLILLVAHLRLAPPPLEPLQPGGHVRGVDPLRFHGGKVAEKLSYVKG